MDAGVDTVCVRQFDCCTRSHTRTTLAVIDDDSIDSIDVGSSGDLERCLESLYSLLSLCISQAGSEHDGSAIDDEVVPVLVLFKCSVA